MSSNLTTPSTDQSEDAPQHQLKISCQEHREKYQTIANLQKFLSYHKYQTILSSQQKTEKQKLEETIKEGQNFNRKFLQKLQRIDGELADAIAELDDWHRAAGTHMTHPLQDYKSCITMIDRQVMEVKLNQDIKMKSKELEDIQMRVERQNQQLEEYMTKHKQELERIFSSIDQQQVESQEKKQYQLKKLPLLMEDFSHDIEEEFQWPQQEELQQIMTSDSVRIQKLEVWEDNNTTGVIEGLHSIRLTLNNGMKSPLFEAKGARQCKKTLNFVQQIRQLAIKSAEQDVVGLSFLDQDGTSIAQWQTKNCHYYDITKELDWDFQDINQKKTVIGIYGKFWHDESQSDCGIITSLGFMTIDRN